MSFVFSIKNSDSTNYCFELLDSDQQVLLISGDFDTPVAAEACIAQVKVGSLMGHQIAAGKTSNGEMFFVIKNEHGQIIAKSLLFTQQMDFDNALHQVKDNACIAEIETDLEAAQ